MSNEALQLIKATGDILERSFFSDEGFATSFDLYPLVWQRHVLCLRKPGSSQLDLAHPHAKFAMRHYTTIVRCWMAYVANKEIASQCLPPCETPSVVNQLKLHRLLFEFYCSMGAAIDNMKQCYESEPICNKNAFENLRDNKAKQYPDRLEWLWHRRHQFIHSTLVPCFYMNDLLHLNEGIFETKWKESWADQSPGKNTEISELCNTHWLLFMREMQESWRELESLFPKTFSQIPSPMFLGTVMPSLTACSGTPPDWSPPASGQNWSRTYKEQPKDKNFGSDYF